MSKFRRQLMMANTGAAPVPPPPPLPYDAEIEYLESTGTQYIDTGVDLKKMMVAKYRIEFTSVSGIQVIFGVYANISRGQLYINGTGWRDYSANNMRSSGWTGGAAIGTIYDITSYNPNINTSDYTMYIFARNTDDNTPTPTKMRLYSMTMTQDGILVRDFIPVRVGQTGMLYDRVSGQLFGNAGTGEFTIGPDKILSYDAEIEYLESTGTSGFFLDTGISRPSTFESAEIVIDVQFNTTAGRQIMGATSALTMGVNANRWEGGYNEYKGTADTNRHTLSKRMWVSSNRSYFRLRVDNTDYTLKDYDYSDAHFSSDVALFNYDIGSSIGTNCKIYGVQIYVNDELAFDGIPVRVGQVGYMYDRVIGTLFGNAGTGDFILGNDKN